MGNTENTENQAAEVTKISLADICKEMGIKPQSARVKLRKKLAGAKGEGFRWEFDLDRKAEIVALLTPAPKAETKAGEDEGDGDGEGEDDGE